MNLDPIIMAMVSCIDMLDAAEPDEVEPSYAVKVQQVMGEYLQAIPPSDEPELRTMLLRIAGDVSEEEPTIAAYLRQWAGNLGE
ncbi:hypothetical protein BJP40_07285 [Streptomyces sp. CC53]|uniref:hypothetical protein n=1 Tax=unclassified Streptomyces TaxID=2593676 RepID=UPI0008DC8B2F|nr:MULTISPECIES: hypothetical protein [unclassified Streptomyces]OII61036.1 hypothetical protein BJP40_07285 [Streptomyces sp. CC53]